MAFRDRVLLVWGFFLLVTPLLGAESKDFCTVCHSEVAVRHRAGVHQDEEMTCTTCHGGDASQSEEAAAHGGSFKGRVSRASIPEFCASCHADPVAMRPYGLPTDQYALYLTSEHGRELAKGNADVAICTDCHGTHRILSRTAPDSPTSHRNITTTCGQCHANDKMMEQAGLSADVIQQFEGSVHADALRQRSRSQAPNCSRCHGNHGAAPPGVGHVSKVCGRCHEYTRDAFRQSVHAAAEKAGEIRGCVACHDTHAIGASNSSMWTSACVQCHDAGSEAARTGDKILTLFTQAEEELQRANESVQEAATIPLDVEDYLARLEAGAAYLTQARPISHTLDLVAIEETTRKARSIALEIQGEVHEKIRATEGRTLIVLFFWLYILITIVAIHYYKRRA